MYVEYHSEVANSVKVSLIINHSLLTAEHFPHTCLETYDECSYDRKKN